MFQGRRLSFLVLASLSILLSVVLTSCSDSGGDDDTPSRVPAGLTVGLVADTGTIVAVRVGEQAVLDGSHSTSTLNQPLTYAWSFTYKPEGSKAVLQNATSPNPSFTADVWGTYMVELVVSSAGASSKRNIATVVATNDNESPTGGMFIHVKLRSNCVDCHNSEPNSPLGKSGDHPATSNLCQACHTPNLFNDIRHVDHLEVFGACSTCHDGEFAIGKSSWHIKTIVECDSCHNTVSFLELGPDGKYDHSTITRECVGCHNGTVAIGKGPDHVETTSECNRCHSIEGFVPVAFVDHSVLDFTVQTCVFCHDGDGPGASSVGKTPNHPVTSDNCQVCHNTRTFNLEGNFNHDVIDDENIPCVSCHNGEHVAAGARGMTDTTVHANATATSTDCGNCHNTRDFLQAFIDHTSAAVTDFRCDDCHNNVDQIGKPDPNHIPTTEDCGTCHTPGNFATGFFDHDPAIVDPVRCDSCHDDVVMSGKPPNHVATTDDCRTCHGTDTFSGATVDHSTITGNCGSCHNGVSATGKVDKPNHIPTLDDCVICHTVDAFAPSTFLTDVHTNITSDCQSCHNGKYSIGKPRDTHIPTVDDCNACHITSDFKAATFAHEGITRGCGGCHNGRFTTAEGAIRGQPPTHMPTPQDCHFCHNTTAFSPSIFDHVGITDNCASCHNGNYVGFNALGAPNTPIHTTTTQDCGVCHNITDFAQHFVDHSSPEVLNVRCDSCHNGNAATGKNTGHVETSQDCGVCHTPGASFVPAVFDHSNLPRNTRCDSCHGVTAKGMSPNHITIQPNQDCSDCHNTTAFAGARFDHQGITGNCGLCHNGDTAIGKPNNHVPTNDDCVVCHQTTGFIPATFDHTGIVDNCQSCHDGVLATGKDANHVVTNQDCSVCHTTSAFIPAGFDHSGIVDNCARSGCHGSGATGKNPGHLQTTLDCSNCHTTTTFVGGKWVHDASTAGRCLDCHVTGGGATPQPTQGHFVTGPGVQCDACHTTNGWGDQGTFDHCPNTNANNNRCGNYPGDHRAGRVACIDCHTKNTASFISYPNDPQYAPFCAGCHAGNFRRKGDHIGGSNGTVAQNKDCGQSGCHRVSSSGF